MRVLELLQLPLRLLGRWWVRTSPERFLQHLRHRGVKVGVGVKIFADLRTIRIDLTRPSLVSIGNNVCLNQNFTLLTHDYGSFVFRNLYNDFLASSGGVRICDNVVFGSNVTVLKGVTIGENCIIGAGAVITKNIPPNSVVVGVPGKVICTLEEYYHKRQVAQITEALLFAQSIQERFGRRPRPTDFREEFVLWVNGADAEKYPELPIKQQLKNAYPIWCEKHKAVFKDFEAFLEAAGIK